MTTADAPGQRRQPFDISHAPIVSEATQRRAGGGAGGGDMSTQPLPAQPPPQVVHGAAGGGWPHPADAGERQRDWSTPNNFDVLGSSRVQGDIVDGAAPWQDGRCETAEVREQLQYASGMSSHVSGSLFEDTARFDGANEHNSGRPAAGMTRSEKDEARIDAPAVTASRDTMGSGSVQDAPTTDAAFRFAAAAGQPVTNDAALDPHRATSADAQFSGSLRHQLPPQQQEPEHDELRPGSAQRMPAVVSLRDMNQMAEGIKSIDLRAAICPQFTPEAIALPENTPAAENTTADLTFVKIEPAENITALQKQVKLLIRQLESHDEGSKHQRELNKSLRAHLQSAHSTQQKNDQGAHSRLSELTALVSDAMQLNDFAQAALGPTALTSEQLSKQLESCARRREELAAQIGAANAQVRSLEDGIEQEGGRGRWLEEQVSHLEAAAAEARGGFLGLVKSRGLARRLCDHLFPTPVFMYRIFGHFVQCAKHSRALRLFASRRFARHNSQCMATAFRALTQRVFLAKNSKFCEHRAGLQNLRTCLREWRLELSVQRGSAFEIARKQRLCLSRWLAFTQSRQVGRTNNFSKLHRLANRHLQRRFLRALRLDAKGASSPLPPRPPTRVRVWATMIFMGYYDIRCACVPQSRDWL